MAPTLTSRVEHPWDVVLLSSCDTRLKVFISICCKKFSENVLRDLLFYTYLRKV